MDLLDVMQSFVERCERSAPATELSATLQGILEQLGFRYFACCSHVDFKNPPQRAVILHTYPKAWVRSFADGHLHEYDPVFRRSEKEILPFHWDAPEFRATLTPAQERILREAASMGIAHGYTVPIHLPWSEGALRASCSVVPDAASIGDRVYRAVQVMAMYLYASVAYGDELRAARDGGLQAGPVLSARERQCLELAAHGKSDWAISQILSISEHTVHTHVESVKRRLGVSTRVQAIVWAANRREISLGDVVHAHVPRKSATSQRVRSPQRVRIRKSRLSRRTDRSLS